MHNNNTHKYPAAVNAIAMSNDIVFSGGRLSVIEAGDLHQKLLDASIVSQGMAPRVVLRAGSLAEPSPHAPSKRLMHDHLGAVGSLLYGDYESATGDMVVITLGEDAEDVVNSAPAPPDFGAVYGVVDPVVTECDPAADQDSECFVSMVALDELETTSKPQSDIEHDSYAYSSGFNRWSQAVSLVDAKNENELPRIVKYIAEILLQSLTMTEAAHHARRLTGPKIMPALLEPLVARALTSTASATSVKSMRGLTYDGKRAFSADSDRSVFLGKCHSGWSRAAGRTANTIESANLDVEETVKVEREKAADNLLYFNAIFWNKNHSMLDYTSPAFSAQDQLVSSILEDDEMHDNHLVHHVSSLAGVIKAAAEQLDDERFLTNERVN